MANNEDHFRYILKTSKVIRDVEKRLFFVLSHINLLEEVLHEDEDKKNTIKGLVTWALREFNEGYKCDKRMLNLWKLMGKYSENMGMDGVLENVHRLGFFKECCEFYLIWADHWGAQGQRDKFNKIVEMCEENCHLSHFDSDELFKPLFVKYFDAEKSMDGQTLDLMKMLAPRKEDIRSDLTLFQHQHHTSNTQQGSTHKDGQQRGMGSGEKGQLQQQQPTLQLQSTSVEAVVPMPTVESTVAPYHEEFSIFKDPTNIIQAPQKPLHLGNPNQPTNAAKVQQQDLMEFSVYKDQSIAIQPSSQQKPEKVTTPPPAKQEVKEQEQKLPTPTQPAPAIEEKGDSDKKQSYYPDISDITLAGSHGKYASSVFTSTPRRSIMMTTFDPVLDAQKEQEQQFFDDLLEESQRSAGGAPGLFGTGTSSSKEMLAEGGGGSKLQKRLSLLTGEQPQQTRRESIGAAGVANSNAVTEAFERAKKAAKNTSYNLLKTLPKLKIGTSTPIMEVSEDKENTGNATANSAARTKLAATPFASPFRKKTRMDEQPKVSLEEEEQQKEAQSLIENEKVADDQEMPDAPPMLESHAHTAVECSNIEPNRVTPSQSIQKLEQKSATQANGNNNQGRRQSYYPDMNDDVTMAGFHGKFSSTVFMSTPRRSIMPSAFDPVLDDVKEKEQEQQFFDDLLEESQRSAGGPPGLFGAGTSSSKEMLAEGGGGSKLQKRLSLLTGEKPQQTRRVSFGALGVANSNAVEEIANDMNTQPKLKVGFASTIMEVSEDKENTTGNVTANSAVRTQNSATTAVSSPFQKKTRMDDNEDEGQPKAPVAVEEEKQQKEAQSPTQDADLDVSTHMGHVIEKIKSGTVNPWDEQMRSRVLAEAPPMMECHKHTALKCSRIDLNRVFSLGNEQFNVIKLLGEGGFARVYKAKSLQNEQIWAIKYENPPCPWEVYICASLKRRIRPEFLHSVMQVRDAYVFSNASAIVYDYCPHGTLLDLSNMYKKNGTEMGGLLATYFAIQLGRILEQVHTAANIIHGDVKPDNVVLRVGCIDERMSLEQLLQQQEGTLQLIDWGRSIDMNCFPEGQKFIGCAGTENFDCVEMISGMPWTYQTDFYGFIASMYVLLKGEYLVTFKYAGKNVPTKVLKRRMILYDMWQQIFDQFLNIPNCDELPKWSEVNRRMEEQLSIAVATEFGQEWKKAIERFNGYMKQQQMIG